MMGALEMPTPYDGIFASGRDSTRGLGAPKRATSSSWRNPRRLPG